MTAATEIWFYHLERSSVEDTLPPLLEKCLERDWRVAVRCGDAERLTKLDSLLWSYKPMAWLPHAAQTGDAEFDARQPILLTANDTADQTASALFLLDGTDWAGVTGVLRIFVLFDGRDESAVARARDDWRRGKAAGFVPAYWRQSEDGKWTRT